MLSYYIVECACCENLINMWVGIGLSERQMMIFCCPCCNAEIHVVLLLNYANTSHEIESHDIIVKNEERNETLKGVNIYSDLPVRKDKQGVSLAFGGSAFLDLAMRLRKDLSDVFNEYKDRVHSLYLAVFPMIRRTKNIYLLGNYKDLGNQIKKIKELNFEKGDYYKTIQQYHNLLIAFAPKCIQMNNSGTFVFDLYAVLIYNRKNYLDVYKQLVSSYWNSLRYEAFSSRLLDLYVRFLVKFDAVLLGTAYLFLELSSQSTEEYLVFRDDFNELKSIYIDGYELLVQALTYIVPMYNLRYRKNAESWSSGKIETIEQFSKKTAFNKEFSFKNETYINSIYSNINRNLRNKIGHYDIIFNFSEQVIKIGTSEEIHLSEFLKSFVCVFEGVCCLLCFERFMKLDSKNL